ncbi:MAG TPA: hypothetical protein VF145_02880 [Chitinophagaceae bacterium]
MYQGLLHTHNLLRWVILIFLLLSIFRQISAGSQPFGKRDKGFGLPLLIAAHLTLLIGLYQWAVGEWGLALIQKYGMGEVMKDSVTRFWAVEHPLMMIIAIILITIGYGQRKSRHTARIQRRRTLIYYFLALVAIVLAVPWPFREVIGRPLFPGM